MKRLFIIFTFIFFFALNSFAADFNITSLTVDNSGSILLINTNDNSVVQFNEKPVIKSLENKVYFDINSAVLKVPKQHFILANSPIKEIVAAQFSNDPDVVRISVSYEPSYNPNNIQLKKLNNTLFLSFFPLTLNNYYFGSVYSETKVSPFYEDLSVQIPVVNNIGINQIASAFGQNVESDYVLTKKNTLLVSKFFIDNVNIINNFPVINGIGEYTISRPLRLANPERIVYDIPNAVVNPVIRNKVVQINQTDTIKIGQFDKTTARVVISSPDSLKYIPVLYSDTQKIIFYNKNSNLYNGLFSLKANFNSVNVEKVINNEHSLKLVFSAPVVYALERTSSELNIYLYNVDKYPQNIKSELLETAFSNLKVLEMKNGGMKLSMPVELYEYANLYSGHDGKILRLKYKTSKLVNTSKDLETPKIVIPSVLKKDPNKIIVVIDPGHGGTDYGAIRESINEKDIVLDVSKRVESLLKKKGYDVIMTRDSDIYVSLQDRVDASEMTQADIFVSIHVNSSNSESPNGIETHYYKDNSLQLAKCLHASLLNNISAHDRGLFKSKFYVINHTTAPAVLLETGFISNPAERAQLVTDGRKNAAATAIAEGIDEYFKQK